MKNTPRQSGFVMLESLVAIGLASMFFSGLIGLALIANETSGKAAVRQQAVWRAQEGVEALQTIAFEDLVLTDTGALSFTGNEWALSETGPQDLGNGLERTVRVQEVMRDGVCEVTDSGGDPDDDSRYLESEVSWEDMSGRTQTVNFRTLRTRWNDPQGACFAPMAGSLSIDFSQTSWHGGKQLRDTFLTNTGSVPITIDKVRMTWDYDTEIEQLFVDNNKIWSQSGPGTPTGTQPSGTWLDPTDVTIGAEATVEIPKVQFLDDMEGATLTVEMEFTDGSIFTSDPFTP